MDDCYQQAVEYLTENPEGISGAWKAPRMAMGGCLFRFAGHDDTRPDNCGCLTMIRRTPGQYAAQTPEMTKAIIADDRLPNRSSEITVDHLPVFAGWQRRLDIMCGRPTMPLDSRLPAPKGDIEIPAIEFEFQTV